MQQSKTLCPYMPLTLVLDFILSCSLGVWLFDSTADNNLQKNRNAVYLLIYKQGTCN